MDKCTSIFSNKLPQAWPMAITRLPGLTDFAIEMLEQCKLLQKPSNDASAVDLEKFKQISSRFPCEFPISTCRVANQPDSRTAYLKQQISSAYPIIHERTLLLYINFLEHKRKYGNAIERRVYEHMTVGELVQRLLTKRCIYFVGSSDDYMLLNGAAGGGGFEQIGTMEEKPPLLLKDVLSYDEIKLSALLNVSTYSEFINDGNRTNAGLIESNKSRIETQGVIMGIIGGRFERANVMEYQDIMITSTQNLKEHGYGSNDSNTRLTNYRHLWRNFYEEPKDFLFSDVKVDNVRFGQLYNGKTIFDNFVMRKRYAITIDTLLLESEARAVAAGKPAFIHVVGIGLGVWQVNDQQPKIFLEAFEERLNVLSDRLTHIGTVHFSWMRLKSCGTLHDGARIGANNILVRFSNRNPADKLAEDQLLIVTYAWDGNALPGNEFWMNSLAGSGDPAAACSTLITELQNAHINTVYMNGANLHVASMQHGVVHVAEYAKKLLQMSEK